MECNYGTSKHHGPVYKVEDPLRKGEFGCLKHLTTENIFRRMKGEPKLIAKEKVSGRR